MRYIAPLIIFQLVIIVKCDDSNDDLRYGKVVYAKPNPYERDVSTHHDTVVISTNIRPSKQEDFTINRSYRPIDSVKKIDPIGHVQGNKLVVSDKIEYEDNIKSSKAKVQPVFNTQMRYIPDAVHQNMNTGRVYGVVSKREPDYHNPKQPFEQKIRELKSINEDTKSRLSYSEKIREINRLNRNNQKRLFV